ncbi:MAG TPA: DUF3048 domain-containing protein [Microbacteriaceae bacterium]|nr:DUF3048 domain-containing protein [Microbacteriaceae bacterium]
MAIRARLFAGVLVGALALSGCAGGSTAMAPTPTRPVPSSGVDPISLATAPLTGELVPGGLPTRPALAAKVDNHEDARPQWALNQADLVFEELVEGGLTRYVAVWHSQLPEVIGPVRSIRPMDPDIISPLGGIVAYSGGQTRFVAMMQAAPVVNVSADFNDEYYFRSDERDAPHNEMLNTAPVLAAHAELAPPAAQFLYGTPAHIASQGGSPASRLDIAFSSASQRAWEWDATSLRWLRSQSDVADTVYGGERTSAVNVVVVRVRIDWTYSPVPRTVMVDSGDAIVATAGMVLSARWSKASATDPIVLTDASGAPLRLLPGRTWVELVPVDGSASAR